MAFQDEAMGVASRLRLGHARRPLLVGVAAVLALAVLAVGTVASRALCDEGFSVVKAEAVSAPSAAGAAEGESSAAEAVAQMCVHVSGAVARPDIYFLDEGSRVADAIVAAGGFTDEAAADALNLARVLNDGEQIAVPTEEAVAGAAGQGQAQAQAGAAGGASATTAGGLVNINSADAAALQTLDGVGEATAKKIIADREANGPFRTIEDLMRVSGIGEKKFANLRGSICV